MIRAARSTAFGLLVLWALASASASPTPPFFYCSIFYEPHPDAWDSLLSSTNPRFTPQWSPDGDQVVFMQLVFMQPGYGDHEYGSIFVAQADGSRIRRILKSDDRYDLYYSPDVSPDGSGIVYATSRHLKASAWQEVEGKFEIETSRLDGSHERRLTENIYLDTAPAWSPDATRIAFVRQDTWAASPGIYTISPDGSAERQVMAFRSFRLEGEENVADTLITYGPTWSPDGKRLAYVIIESVEGHISRGVLYTIGIDGVGPTRLFAADSSFTDYLGTAPAWSCDGERVAFTHYEKRARGGALSLYVINHDGSDLTKVVIVRRHRPPCDRGLVAYLRTDFYSLRSTGMGLQAQASTSSMPTGPAFAG